MSDQLPDAELIALAASKIVDAVERQAYVKQACGGDEQLRQQVYAILVAPTAHAEQPSLNGLAATAAIGAVVASSRDGQSQNSAIRTA